MDEARPTRREALKIAGAAAGGAMLTGLGVSAIGTARSAMSLSSLARRLDGTLVVPGQSSYAAAAAVWNPRLSIQPRAIAFCRSIDDVRAVVRFASERGWPLSARSGRHSFEGYCNCTGIVADVSQIDSIRVGSDRTRVTIGAGASNLQVFEQLVLGQGLGISTGSCPSVGIAGLALGGGLSRGTRQRGMLVDDMLEARVVLPDGRYVKTSTRERPDLFWGLRGAGGGNFGIVTSLTFRTHSTPGVFEYSVTYPWSYAAQGMDQWQRFAPFAPRQLSSSTYFMTRVREPSGEYKLKATSGGLWYGSQADLEALIEPLRPGATAVDVKATSYVQAWKPDDCEVGPGNQVTCSTLPVYDAAYPNYQKSDYFNEFIPPAGLEALVYRVAQWPGGPGAYEGGVHIEATGPTSRVNAIRPDTTSFVHRNSLYHCCYVNFWGQARSQPANVAWVDDIYSAMRPYASGQAYQNYIDGELKNWRSAYYGSNWDRLRRVKRKYDPQNLLAFRQGIKPAR